MTTNQIFRTGQSSKSPAGQWIFLSRFLANISMAWKMGLMAFVLFLGTLGVAGAAYSGLQSMRYQLSNIYDFMLVPIVAISHADTALADAQSQFETIDRALTLAASLRLGPRILLSAGYTVTKSSAPSQTEEAKSLTTDLMMSF